MPRTLIALGAALVVFGSLLFLRQRRTPAVAPAASNDSAFAAIQERGKAVMGVDQYASQHRFTQLPEGGRITLALDPADTAGVTTIRTHMSDVARRFSQGDFALTSMVHAPVVPGTAEMAGGSDRIRYSVENVPGGATLWIQTRDPELVKAIHEFLEFQSRDHRSH